MAEEDKVKWRLGQQKTFGIETIDRPNLREMQEYITGKDMMDFYKTASKEQVKAVNQLAADMLSGARGGTVSAAQFDQLMSDAAYRTRMRKVGADVMRLAGSTNQEDRLRLKAMNLKAQANLPKGELPQRYTMMPMSARSASTTTPSISDAESVSEDAAGPSSMLNSKEPLRKRRTLLGG